MMLKIMGLEDIPDGDSRKTFRLLADVSYVNFRRSGPPEFLTPQAWADVVYPDGEAETFEVLGNAYVMNDDGKTISSFGVSQPQPTNTPG